MTAIFQVQNLSVKRGGREVLHVDHLQVMEGEVTAVIGPNGAGKSTLLLALSRTLLPEGGEITFCGQALEDLDLLSYRRRTGLVLQEPLLLDRSVFDNVAAGLRFRHLPKREVEERARAWLEQFGVAHLEQRPAKKLSGGEAQRVSLARAFALEPEVLFLDEPFSALDAPTRSKLLDDFQTVIAAANLTTIFVTHDLDEALYLGDCVAVLLDGHLRQVGPPQEVFTAPTDPDVAAFVGVETVLSGEVVSSQNGYTQVEASGYTLDVIGEFESGREVLLCLRPEDVTLWPEGDPPLSSARNRLVGNIQRMVPQGPLVKIVVDCGFPVVAMITRASADELGLELERPVAATFKASAAHMIPR